MAGHMLGMAQMASLMNLAVEVDTGRMAQVLANLLNNAAKYTDRGGSIVLRAERRGRDPDEVDRGLAGRGGGGGLLVRYEVQTGVHE